MKRYRFYADYNAVQFYVFTNDTSDDEPDGVLIFASDDEDEFLDTIEPWFDFGRECDPAGDGPTDLTRWRARIDREKL